MNLRSELQNFLGIDTVVASPRMRDVLVRAQRIAQTQASVLIAGESGSGKEVVARSIHHYSPRNQKPWVDINCGALPEHLIESELFGYEKGAFSGAESQKPGLFEMADKGTLFLDEIGELDAKMQVKLLRVLDRVPYYRLGGHKKISVDVRVLAASNQDLPKLIREGRFRADLYHRLSQVKLQVPPLRDRPEDAIALARFFLGQQGPSLYLSPDAEERILEYAWPGNVRELRNAIVGAAVMLNGNELRAADLVIEESGFDEVTPAYQPPKPFANKSAPSAPANGHSVNLEELERQAILRALDQTGQHQERAAHLLGISSRTLSRKLKSYGLGRALSGAGAASTAAAGASR
jgi:DNA-binding NtrC family response regulator